MRGKAAGRARFVSVTLAPFATSLKSEPAWPPFRSVGVRGAVDMRPAVDTVGGEACRRPKLRHHMAIPQAVRAGEGLAGGVSL